MKKLTIDDLLNRIFFHTNGCWQIEQNRKPHKTGYVYVSFQGKEQLSHRVIYQYFCGEIPENLELDHLCRNRWCCNYAHLEVVTSKENCQRGDRNQHYNITHCIKGHPFIYSNVYLWKGHRHCRLCRIERKAQYRYNKGIHIRNELNGPHYKSTIELKAKLSQY